MVRRRSVRSGFEQRLLANLRSCSLTDQRAVAAFSGGPDSLALAAGLARIGDLLGLEILLVHIDHHLRGASTSDAQHCRMLAVALDLPIEIVELPSGMRERAHGMGIEEQGRRERYGALARIASTWGADAVLTAHQANDQAETVLLHLFRGTGLQGLGGMRMHEWRSIPWWQPAEQPDRSFRLIRPLLEEQRETIEQYLDEMALEPLIDESNRSVEFDRNWIRSEILPRVMERWPGVIATLGRSARAVRHDIDLLDALTETAESAAINVDRTLRTDTIVATEPAIAYRILQRWLYEIGVEEIGFDVVERIYTLAISGNENRMVEAGSGRTVVVAEEALTTLDDLLRRANLAMPLDIESGPWRIEIDPTWIDSELAIIIPTGDTPVVRPLRAGDRWYGTERPVFEDLRSAGIHPLLRERVLAIAAAGGVLLIPAIYPTIRTVLDGSSGVKAGVRWRKRNQ